MVATFILISITVAALAPVAYWVSTYRLPGAQRRVNLRSYAGLINDNIVRIHIQHQGGQTVYDPLISFRGWGHPFSPIENRALRTELYCWTFEDPNRFRLSDWAHAELQCRGAGFRVGDQIWLTLVVGRSIIFDQAVGIDEIDRIPG